MNSISVLMLASLTIAFTHTVIGVDHYLPFIMIGKARRWSMSKVLWVTGLCGVGHVLSSVVLGLLGIAMGSALGKLEKIEAIRGSFAAWALICFGLIYAIWSWRRIAKGKFHSHSHSHSHNFVGAKEVHEHGEHSHCNVQFSEEEKKESYKQQTVWTLFIIFVLGPCEPLIPLLMYPAWEQNWWGLVMVTISFSLVTIGTMLMMVFAGIFLFDTTKLEGHFINKYANVIAGVTIALSGLAIQFLGL